MKVRAKEILKQAQAGVRHFPVQCLSDYYKRHLKGQPLETWKRIEAARSFAQALSVCPDSDPRARQAGIGYLRGVKALERAWEAWNGVDARSGKPLGHYELKERELMAGKAAMEEFRGIVNHGGRSWKDMPEGALKSVETIRLGFRSAARGEAGVLKPAPRATYTRIKERVR